LHASEKRVGKGLLKIRSGKERISVHSVSRALCASLFLPVGELFFEGHDVFCRIDPRAIYGIG
jgi:hypothetical protein